MHTAAADLEFETAARLRDEIKRLRDTELAIADDPLARQSEVEDKAGIVQRPAQIRRSPFRARRPAPRGGVAGRIKDQDRVRAGAADQRPVDSNAGATRQEAVARRHGPGHGPRDSSPRRGQRPSGRRARGPPPRRARACWRGSARERENSTARAEHRSARQGGRVRRSRARAAQADARRDGPARHAAAEGRPASDAHHRRADRSREESPPRPPPQNRQAGSVAGFRRNWRTRCAPAQRLSDLTMFTRRGFLQAIGLAPLGSFSFERLRLRR